MRVVLGTSALAASLVVLGQLEAGTRGKRGPTVEQETSAPMPAGMIGPDVITAELPSSRKWATGSTSVAYSLGTTSCNIGDENLAWQGGSLGIHPLIGQNMFRLLDGRFEQIGQAWIKHGFCALQFEGGCGDCPGEMGCLDYLAPGCADPYSASRNGSQFGLGPKWEINAHTGDFEYPFHEGEGREGEFRRRLRVLRADLALDGAEYFIEGQYVHADDSASGNQNNNASYRRTDVNDVYTLNLNGPTQRGKAAIRAWIDSDPTVTIHEVQVPDEGLFLVGYNVYDNEDGTWDYEFAIQNLNSHRSAQAFAGPSDPAVTVTNIGFHDVPYDRPRRSTRIPTGTRSAGARSTTTASRPTRRRCPSRRRSRSTGPARRVR
jgi:hypothetical protein